MENEYQRRTEEAVNGTAAGSNILYNIEKHLRKKNIPKKIMI